MPISIYTTIDDPLAASNNTGETVALGINGLGQIVGFWSYADTIGRSHSHGFLLTGGTYTSIDDPLATNTFAVGINDAGQVAGNYIDASGTSHGFVYSGGTWTTLDDPAAHPGTTAVTGINDSGQIVGWYQNLTGWHGFLYSGGTYTNIDDPLATTGATRAFGINNLGQIVGSYGDSTGGHGFLLSGGIYTNIDDPLGTSTDAFGITTMDRSSGFMEGATQAASFTAAAPTSTSTIPWPPMEPIHRASTTRDRL